LKESSGVRFGDQQPQFRTLSRHFFKESVMKYLVSIHRPNDYNHAEQLRADARRAIDAVNDEMVAAGARIFVGGLRSPNSATSIRWQTNGEVLITDGPFLESKEYVDGFWVLECGDLDEALEWGRKAAAACEGSVEVRPFAGATVDLGNF
jgi:hypothetical protein